MDHGGPIPMVNDFGGLTPDSSFLNQPGGPGGGSDHLLNGPRGGSPEFMNSGNFSEPQNMQNEGLVWWNWCKNSDKNEDDVDDGDVV